jgi:Tfp pilus assembly protein PilF
MSLINKVLDNLEREKKGSVKAKQSLAGIVPDENASSWLKEWLPIIKNIALGLAVLLMLIFVYKGTILLKYNKKAHALNIPTTKVSALETLTPITTTSSSETAVALQGIKLSGDNYKTILNFSFNGPTYYYLTRNGDEKLLLTLGNATNKVTNNTPFDFHSTAIKNILFEQKDKDVAVNIDVMPGTQITELQFYREPQSYLQLVLLNPQKQIANVSFGQLRKTVHKDFSNSAVYVKYQDALRDLETGDTAQAVKKLKEIVKENRNYSSARETLAKVLIDIGQEEDAEKIIKEGFDRNPTDAGLTQMWAYQVMKKGRISEAISVLTKNPPQFEDNYDYYALLAGAYQKVGDFESAEKIYQRLLQARPDQGNWWLGLGICLEGQRKNNFAIEAYQRALNSGQLSSDVEVFLRSKVGN